MILFGNANLRDSKSKHTIQPLVNHTFLIVNDPAKVSTHLTVHPLYIGGNCSLLRFPLASLDQAVNVLSHLATIVSTVNTIQAMLNNEKATRLH